MTYDWAQYLVLADALSRNPLHPEEASLRSAVSRAYYAAFGEARLVAEGRGLTLQHSPSDHQIVIGYFRRMSQSHGKEVGKVLNELRMRRNRADYDDSFTSPAAEAHIAVMEASRIMALLKMVR